MPELKTSFNAPINPDERWGRGMERFGFWYVDSAARQWHLETILPPIITLDTLSGAPNTAVALLREVSFQRLADNLKVGNPDHCMHVIAEMGLGEVGAVTMSPTDNGRTVDYVIPISSGGSGEVQIVINKAWGVHWRLSPNHPLVQTFPQLGITHVSDESEPPTPSKENHFPPPYLAPDVLAQATDPGILDVATFAHDLHDLLVDLRKSPKTAVTNANWSSLGPGYDDQTHSVCIQLREAGVLLHLGINSGHKQVRMHGSANPRYTDSANTSQRAAVLDSQWKLLHHYISDKKRG